MTIASTAEHWDFIKTYMQAAYEFANTPKVANKMKQYSEIDHPMLSQYFPPTIKADATDGIIHFRWPGNERNPIGRSPLEMKEFVTKLVNKAGYDIDIRSIVWPSPFDPENIKMSFYIIHREDNPVLTDAVLKNWYKLRQI